MVIMVVTYVLTVHHLKKQRLVSGKPFIMRILTGCTPGVQETILHITRELFKMFFFLGHPVFLQARIADAKLFLVLS